MYNTRPTATKAVAIVTLGGNLPLAATALYWSGWSISSRWIELFGWQTVWQALISKNIRQTQIWSFGAGHKKSVSHAGPVSNSLHWPPIVFYGALWCSVLHSLSVLAWPLQPLIILSTRLVRTGRTRRIRSPFPRSYKNKTRAEEKKCTLIILLLNTIIIGCLFYLPRCIATCFYKFKKLAWTIPNGHQMQVRKNKSSDQQIDDF